MVDPLWSPALSVLLGKLRRRQGFDIVVAGRVWCAEQARHAGYDDVVVDVDDVPSEAMQQMLAHNGRYFRRPLHALELLKTRRYERRLTRRFSTVLVCKEQDVEYFGAAEDRRVAIIPNGVDLPTSTAASGPDNRSLLFVGTLGYAPNVDGVRHFHSQMWPSIRRAVPTASFRVAGRAYSRHANEIFRVYEAVRRSPGCEIVESPEHLGPIYEDAAIVVAPLRMGGGTRIKILEAMAYGRPVVSTRFAAEGLGLTHRENVLFADTPAAFAEACIELLLDASLRSRIGHSGRTLVESRFAWPQIEAQIRQRWTDGAAVS